MKAAIWTTERGIVVGTSSGQLVNVTEKRAIFTPSVNKAAAFVRRLNGQNHYVSVVQS